MKEKRTYDQYIRDLELLPQMGVRAESTLTPQTIGRVLGEEVLITDEEVNPDGVKIERYIAVEGVDQP